MKTLTTAIRSSLTAASFVTSLAFAAPALAAIPPISEEMLAAQSELIVDAKVTAVACAAPEERSANGGGVITERPYISTLEVLAKHKGEAGATISYRGFGLETPAGWAGPQPSRPLPVGWAGKLHLKSRGGGVYEQTYTGNDVAEDKTRSQPQPLPTCAAGGDDDGGCSFGGRPAGGGAALGSLMAGLLALATLIRRRRR